MYTITQLKGQNWTDALIGEHLGDPDLIRPNPYSRAAAPMRLYDEERVKRAEESDGFRLAQDRRKARRAGAAKAVATKHQQMTDYVDGLEIIVPTLPVQEVRRLAIDAYNARQLERCKDGRASIKSDSAFLDRIAVNYLRHELSMYEYELERIAGKVGVRAGYTALRRKVCQQIAETYPDLASECERQIGSD